MNQKFDQKVHPRSGDKPPRGVRPDVPWDGCLGMPGDAWDAWKKTTRDRQGLPGTARDCGILIKLF